MTWTEIANILEQCTISLNYASATVSLIKQALTQKEAETNELRQRLARMTAAATCDLSDHRTELDGNYYVPYAVAQDAITALRARVAESEAK